MGRWKEASPEINHYDITSTRTKRGQIQHMKKQREHAEESSTLQRHSDKKVKRRNLKSRQSLSGQILDAIPDDPFNVYSTEEDFMRKPSNVRSTSKLKKH